MARYVDGFVLPGPRRTSPPIASIAEGRQDLARVRRPRVPRVRRRRPEVRWSAVHPASARPGETVVFSWIVYKSRAHRDRVNEGDEGPASRQDDGSEGDAL